MKAAIFKTLLSELIKTYLYDTCKPLLTFLKHLLAILYFDKLQSRTKSLGQPAIKFSPPPTYNVDNQVIVLIFC